MKIKVLAFGITKEILGKSAIELEVKPQLTVRELKESLGQQYPDFAKLASLAIAVNSEYAQEEQVLESTDEIALIPPVSGG
jgi:molybdopterin synthase sulfur carrier subunit